MCMCGVFLTHQFKMKCVNMIWNCQIIGRNWDSPLQVRSLSLLCVDYLFIIINEKIIITSFKYFAISNMAHVSIQNMNLCCCFCLSALINNLCTFYRFINEVLTCEHYICHTTVVRHLLAIAFSTSLLIAKAIWTAPLFCLPL